MKPDRILLVFLGIVLGLGFLGARHFQVQKRLKRLMRQSIQAPVQPHQHSPRMPRVASFSPPMHVPVPVPLVASLPPEELLVNVLRVRQQAPKPLPAEKPETFSLEVIPTVGGKQIPWPVVGTLTGKIFDCQQYRVQTVPIASDAPPRFLFTGLQPGTFSLELNWDAETVNPGGYPGDYTGQKFFRAGVSSCAPLLLPLQRLMKLREPVDNSERVPAVITATDGIFLRWDPLEGADSYLVRLLTEGIGWERQHWITFDTAFLATMSPGSYQIQILARSGSHIIGLTQCHTRLVSAAGGVESEKVVVRPLTVKILPGATEPRAVKVKLYQGFHLYAPASGTKVLALLRKKDDSELLEPSVMIGSPTVVIPQVAPGSYQLELMVDVNPANPPGGSGDLFGQADVQVNREDATVSIFLKKFLRLRFPEDSDTPGLAERLDKGGIVKVKNPVALAWDSVGEGATYHYYINPGSVFGTTSATTLVVDLPPGQTCNLWLDSYGAPGTEGKLRLGWKKVRVCYPFQVEASAESPVSER